MFSGEAFLRKADMIGKPPNVGDKFNPSNTKDHIMPYFGQKNIDVTEYSNASVTTRRARLLEINNHTPLTFKSWQLSIAMARTLCNKHIGAPELYIDTIQAFFSLPFLINSVNNNLRLNSNRLNRLRDFSRTNKIGELAQAITWIYLEEESNFPYIVDFELFCNNNGIIIPQNSSTPDFIAQDKALTNNICIAESKGKLINSTSMLKSKLKDGLNQCDIGELLVNTVGTFNVVKKLCFCSEFSSEIDSINSKLHFVDPDKPNIEINYNDYIFRAHYANWFYFIGEFTNADKLLKGELIEFNEKVFTKKEINGEVYWVTNLFEKILQTIDNIESRTYTQILFLNYFLDEKVNIGIADKVVKSLNSKNTTPFDFTSPKSDMNLFFRDGTIITGISDNK